MLDEIFFPQRTPVSAIFKFFVPCFKGQVLSFQKQPLMSQGKSHLVQMDEL